MTEQIELKKVKVGNMVYVIRKENGRTVLENPSKRVERPRQVYRHKTVRRKISKSPTFIPIGTNLEAKDKKQEPECKPFDLLCLITLTGLSMVFSTFDYPLFLKPQNFIHKPSERTT